jgi:hypothetical protein
MRFCIVAILAAIYFKDSLEDGITFLLYTWSLE